MIDEEKEKIWLKKKKNELDKLITEPKDFLTLSEWEQDSLTINPYLEYIDIWDEIGYDTKSMIISGNPTFKYDLLWDKLNEVEKYNVIQVVPEFDWEKFTPNPTEVEMKILILRKDFTGEEMWEKLDYEQKLQICTKPNFNYENFWSDLTTNQKKEVVKYNDDFDPSKYINFLKEEIDDDNNDRYIKEDDKYVKKIIDVYCERPNGNKYDVLWNELSIHQKLTICIKNKDFEIINDNYDELLEGFKKYPFQMMKFIEKIKNTDIFSTGDNRENIDFEKMNKNFKRFTLDIFIQFNITNTDLFEEFQKKQKINGFVIKPKMEKYFPFCIIEEDNKHYFYNVNIGTKILLINFNYYLRELKLKRVLKKTKQEKSDIIK